MSELIDILGTRKFGRVMIDVTTINGGENLIQPVMAKMIPIVTKFNKETNMIEYLSISDEFDELASNELVPIYSVENHANGTVKFKRMSFKKKVEESVKDEIMKIIFEKNVYMDEFKKFIRKYTDATEEDFQTYDETLLEALRIYVDRRDNGTAV